MGNLSGDLESLGYERTEKESPFDDDGMLWSNGVELVCDETAIVIDGDSPESGGGGDDGPFRYPNSEKVKLIGGFFGSYEWGHDEDGFFY